MSLRYSATCRLHDMIPPPARTVCTTNEFTGGSLFKTMSPCCNCTAHLRSGEQQQLLDVRTDCAYELVAPESVPPPSEGTHETTSRFAVVPDTVQHTHM